MSKALIVYGTRTGTAAITAQDIARELQNQGVETKVVDAKKEKIEFIAEYDLIIVGSGIQMGRWTGEPESFLKKFQKELAGKKVALYVNCGSAVEAMNEGKPEVATNARRRYLEEKAAKCNLAPVALGFFGAIYNFNTMSWIMRKGMEGERPKLAAAYKETQPGVYDTRDLDRIRNWTRELLTKMQ
ncbi:MAG: flavodoxin domain-containing protein [Candidatus Methanomethylicaceae archaeon]|jgi:menaquinone-dependent protoporphyrinogen IX oxidase